MKENNEFFEVSEAFFKDLVENKSSLTRAHVYATYRRELEREKEEEEAYELVVNKKGSNANLRVYGGATKIQEGMFIVELHNYTPTYDVVYTPVVDGKQCYEVFLEFDKALLCAIAMKHGVEINGVKYAGMILGIEKNENNKK